MQSQTPNDGPTHSSPVARLDTLRLLVSKAATEGYELKQMDVNTAFLHAPSSKPAHMKIPYGFPDNELLENVSRDKQVLRLKKAVYGLKEAPLAWYNFCSGIFTENGFTRSDNDLCLFSICSPDSESRCFVLVYVDDFTLLAKTSGDMVWLKNRLNSLFDLKDLGAASQVLGIEIIRDRDNGIVRLTQRKFIRQLLEEYDMLDCHPLPTPMFANANASLPSHTVSLTDDEKFYMKDKDFRHLSGCLNWLSLGTRPDIAFALARLGQAQSNPHPKHWQALTHVLRYLSGTLDMGLVYSAKADRPEPHMHTDSAFADCVDTRRSHSGFVVLVGGAAVAWSSRKQAIVTTSSTEAEYIAMGVAAKEAAWMKRLLLDLEFPNNGPLRIYADNQSSLILATSEKLSTRTKHLDVQYHFVRQLAKMGICVFKWVSTKLNVADVLTKPLGSNLFLDMPPRLGLPWIRRNSSIVSETATVSLTVPSGSVVGVLWEGHVTLFDICVW
ncbi:Gag-Pol polyprotein/retrotransposon, putative [Rhizoctonia solani AG-3 Rhs1AP]|uniref:Gag-Pol polyprotein/retrotransposon, putative n=1 Tax=Rhizoctonia solani AG-3 Rhs1AP TaxID=1086054 RepID=A0A0A1UKN8_9AGAM|nr:Gag-Pol polyprotein/retrotransposon, putative [Rhizoctonia solani AG-3 Rhs1AP]